MLITYSNYQKLLGTTAYQKSMLDNLTDKCMRVEAENKVEEDLLQQRRLKNAELDSLKSLGFGLREFKTLNSLIVELATENGQSTENGIGVRNFISDVENHLYDYLRLRKAVEGLKNREALSITLPSKQSRLGRAADALLRKKGIRDDDINNIIEIMESYSPEDTSGADSEARANENGTKDVATVIPVLLESRQSMSHQGVVMSGKTQQAQERRGDFTKVVYKPNPHSAIDSTYRQIKEKIDPSLYSEGDQKNQASQVRGRVGSESNKLADPIGQVEAAQGAKDSESMYIKSYHYPDQADFTKTPRSSEEVTNDDFVRNNDSRMISPNPPLAKGNKHLQAVKPRHLESRKSIHRAHHKTVSTKHGEGQVRVSLVTSVENPDMLLSNHNRHDVSENVDAGHDESSSTVYSSHGTTSIEAETGIQSPEGPHSFKPKKRCPASDSDLTEMMNRAMGMPYHR
jgi:hypothetical protein